MTFNPNYADSLGRELRRQRMHEAQNERLGRLVSRHQPSLLKKVMIILRARWNDFWEGDSHRYPPISHLPKNSTTL